MYVMKQPTGVIFINLFSTYFTYMQCSSTYLRFIDMLKQWGEISNCIISLKRFLLLIELGEYNIKNKMKCYCDKVNSRMRISIRLYVSLCIEFLIFKLEVVKKGHNFLCTFVNSYVCFFTVYLFLLRFQAISLNQ